MHKAGLVLLGLLTAPMAASHADAVRDAALKTVDCQDLVDPQARLECFDRSVTALSDALGTPAVTGVGEAMAEIETRVNNANATDEASVAASQMVALAEETPTAAAGTSAKSIEEAPSWATAPAPQPTREELAQEPSMFIATIVRITRNGVGRHKFYTDDGAVWEQTQIVEIRPPSSLPAEAEIRQRLTGNPTIKFDVSNQAYRVRRIE